MSQTEAVETAAAALAQARRDGTLAPALPDALTADPAAARTLRRAAERALGWRRVGYKIGATSAAIQRTLHADGPFHSALFAERSYADGAALELPEGVLGIECEIALRIAETPSRCPRNLCEARDLVVSVHPAIELVGQRQAGGVRPPVGRCIADFGLSVAFVSGAGRPLSALPALSEIPVSAMVDGHEAACGRGSDVLGHPLNALLALAADLEAEDRVLRAGDWISTGTCVGIVPVVPGQTVVGEFGPLGRVAVRFAHDIK